jgi:polysaccharide export outer membrane protein
MKPPRTTIFSAGLLLICVSALAQQSASKPVLSAAPEPPTAAAAPITPPAMSAVAVDPSYIIGPDDSIQISVWEEPSLSDKLPVRPDGMISLPLVGDIPAAGLTPMQLAANITTQLLKFRKDPVVNVSVLSVNSKRIYLLGEVGRVGPLTLAPGMTILQAISSAGGLTPYASKKHLDILRMVGGKQQKIPFDYTKALKTGNMQGISLEPGDTIVAPS